MILLQVNEWPHDQILRQCSRNACHCLHSSEDMLAILELRPYEKFHCKLLVYRINKSVIKNVLIPETWQSNLKGKKRNVGLVIFKLHRYKKMKWGLLDTFLLQTALKAYVFNYIENWSNDRLICSQNIWGDFKIKIELMKLWKFHQETSRHPLWIPYSFYFTGVSKRKCTKNIITSFVHIQCRKRAQNTLTEELPF